jgi:histone-lysine N-methyltransferase SETMAR
MGSENAYRHAENTENGLSFAFFFERYCKDGNEFLNHIVTGDETWVSCVNVKTKEQSKQWMHTHSPNKPRKFKQTLSARKLMATLFWDMKRVLLVDFLPQGTTITSEMYCETLKKLQRAIQNKRRGMLTSSVVLLHDNARPHMAARTRTLLEQFNWELFDHPPYSPDLAPSDYHLLMHMKNWLRSQCFNNNEELKGDVEMLLSSLAADIFEQGMLQLGVPVRQVPQFRR